MKQSMKIIAGLFALLAGAGCSNMPHFGSQAGDPKPQAQAAGSGYANQTYAANTGDCKSLASQRAAMFNRPDVYPVSAGQQQEAYQALYTQCVNGNTPQVAAASHNNIPYNTASAANFASLSPAAGGNYPPSGAIGTGGAYVASNGMPGATVVVVGGNNANNAAQLSSLSPAAGGSPSSNPTVVYVQAPGAAPATNGYYASPAPAPSYYRQTASLPVAVPVPPQAQGYQPASQAAVAGMPRSTMQPQIPAQNPPVPAVVTAPRPRQPSLASADVNAGTTSAPANDAATQQLENVLEK